jgi:hypothetical protein
VEGAKSPQKEPCLASANVICTADCPPFYGVVLMIASATPACLSVRNGPCSLGAIWLHAILSWFVWLYLFCRSNLMNAQNSVDVAEAAVSQPATDLTAAGAAREVSSAGQDGN